MSTLGNVHRRLGLNEEALALHHEAILLFRDSVPGARGLGGAWLRLGYYHALTSDLENASDAFARAFQTATEEGDMETAGIARVRHGRQLAMLDRLEDAEVELREGLALLDSIGAPPLADWLPQLTLASIVRRRGDLEGADSVLTAVERTMRSQPAATGSAFMSVLNDLAVIRRLRDRHDDAIVLYRELLDSADVRLGPSHPSTLMYRGNYANTLFTAGRFDETVTVHLTALAAMRAEWPEGHWRIAERLMTTGATLISAGRAEEAIPYLSEAVDKGIEHIGDFHAWTNTYRAWLGVAAALTGRDAQANQFFGWSLEGLSSYEGLREDRSVVVRLEALIRVMREEGLDVEVDPFVALLEDDAGPY